MNKPYTPGPWRFGGPVSREHAAVRKHPTVRKDYYEVGEASAFFAPGVAAVGCEADARLIAAAPDLLELLEELVDIVQDAIDNKSVAGLDSFTLQPARAIIAQALGTEKP